LIALIAILVGLCVGAAILFFIVMKIILIATLAIAGLIYFGAFLAMSSWLGEGHTGFAILGAAILGTAFLGMLSWLISLDSKPSATPSSRKNLPEVLCPCGRPVETCLWHRKRPPHPTRSAPVALASRLSVVTARADLHAA
jgi:hypothetical protein